MAFDIDPGAISSVFVALTNDLVTPWDDAQFRRYDLLPTRMALDHAERGQRAVTMTYQNSADVIDVRAFYRCIVTTEISGQRFLVGEGQPESPSLALIDTGCTLRVLCRDFDYLTLQRALMTAAMGNGFAYVPEIAKASSADDVNTILQASTEYVEWTIDGKPFLASIFGDPDKLKVVTPDIVEGQTVETSDNGAPPSQIIATLAIDWNQRAVIDQSIGQMINDEITATAEIYMQKLIAGGFDTPSRQADANKLCTFNPKKLTDSWPAARSVLGNFYVRNSSLVLDKGPGAPTSGKTNAAIADVLQPATLMTSKPTGAKQAGDGAGDFGLAIDPMADPRSNPAGMVWASVESTSFKPVTLDVIGIESRQRRELVTISLTYGGQDYRRGNAEPRTLPFTASGLSDDETTVEYVGDFDYKAGDLRQVSGVVWQCLFDHYADQSSFWENFVGDDPEADDYLQDRWTYVPENKSALGRWDREAAMSSPWGTRAANWLARRLVAEMGFAARTATYAFVVPIEHAIGLDPSWTVRLVHPLLKGGQVEGKVTNIEATWDFDRLQASAKITITGCIGSGDGEPGDPPADHEGDAVTGSGAGMTVRYTVFPYFPEPIDDRGALKVVDRFFGWEQAYLVFDPSQSLYGKSYTAGAPVSDFLENEADTSLSIDFSQAANETGKVQAVAVTMSKWRGPRQVEL